MSETLKLTRSELTAMVQEMSEVFDIVRTVDVSLQKVVTYAPDGKHYESDRYCWDSWNKNGRCKNCISAKAFKCKSRLSKFEFVGPEVFHVVTKYIEVDGEPALLEIVSREDNDVLFDTMGKDRLVRQLQHFAEEAYTDSLTSASNRRYYDEQIGDLIVDAVAMVDVDYFKQVNDTFGHTCGDLALKAVAGVLRAAIRQDDALIRYGGDEFIIAFTHMDPDLLKRRLEDIRAQIEQVAIEGHEDIRLSLSIGAATGTMPARDLVQSADEALYRSKETRNRVTVVEL